MDKNIIEYIEKNIFPIYKLNDKAHDINHIKYVINRSLNFANNLKNININMVYVIAAYHDIGHYIDAKKHEQISADIFLKDKIIQKYFNNDEINIIYEAIIDHRASLEYVPRSIYGKIVSSADRNTSVDDILIRTYEYRKKYNKKLNNNEIILESYQHIIDKYGSNGYAKIYFKDIEYENYLKELNYLINNKKEFIKRYKKVNKID